jgi:hypothetical protein
MLTKTRPTAFLFCGLNKEAMEKNQAPEQTTIEGLLCSKPAALRQK